MYLQFLRLVCRNIYFQIVDRLVFQEIIWLKIYLLKIGFWINNIGIIGYVLVKGLSFSVFNPFDNVNTTSGFLSYRGAFQNYFLYAQDFLTSGTLLMVTSYLRNKKRGLITFAFLLITIGIYLSSGFRYKLF